MPYLRHLQVEHGGDQRLGSVGEPQRAPHRRAGAVQFALLRLLGSAACRAAEVGEGDLDDVVSCVLGATVFEHRQLELHLGAAARFLGLEVPLAGVRAAVRPQRKPIEPVRHTTLPACSSKATVFHSGLLAWPSLSAKSLARR
jgi:hypothetical protein